ncbi:MAG TPA: hypothetical protein VK216_03315 [Magnetospirillaceae bacterium]|nr:hypothetical protein [Magnetospirillaceae bacterium]
MAVQIDAVAEVQKTFQLLFQRKNWLLALPILVGFAVAGICVGIVGAIAFGSLIAGGGLAGAMAGGGDARGPGAMIAMLFSGLGLLFIVALLVGIVIGVFGYAWAYAAAEPIWQGGDPDISGGFSKAMGKLPQLIVLGLIVGVVTLLLFWTFIVPLAVGFFCIYTIPYVMQGNESGTGSIGASINLAKNNFGPTGMLFLALIVVGIVAGIISSILAIIPLLGLIVQLAVTSLVGAFNIAVIMRWYNLLTGAPSAAAPPAPTAPTA